MKYFILLALLSSSAFADVTVTKLGTADLAVASSGEPSYDKYVVYQLYASEKSKIKALEAINNKCVNDLGNPNSSDLQITAVEDSKNEPGVVEAICKIRIYK